VRSKWIAVTVGALVVGATPAIAVKREAALRSSPSTPTPARTTPSTPQRVIAPFLSVTRPTVTRPGIKWTTRGIRSAVWLW
jgi:hypothetical protein